MATTKIEPQLTEYGYQRVMDANGGNIEVRSISLGKGVAKSGGGYQGYDVPFGAPATALQNEVMRRDILSAKHSSGTDENGNAYAKIEYATIFNDVTTDFDAWELGLHDTAGNLIYLWSIAPGVDVMPLSPIRRGIDLIFAFDHFLVFADEMERVTIVDSGVQLDLIMSDELTQITLTLSTLTNAYLNQQMELARLYQELVSKETALAAASAANAANLQNQLNAEIAARLAGDNNERTERIASDTALINKDAELDLVDATTTATLSAIVKTQINPN